jgi:uncharacterized protein with NRDE domain
MCLILFSLNAHPNFPFILAANRDEFYERPATTAHFWKDAPLLLAGRDEQGGGTWCGITRNGRFAALTNYRDVRTLKQNAPTRGHLLTNFLLEVSQASPASGNGVYRAFELQGDLYRRVQRAPRSSFQDTPRNVPHSAPHDVRQSIRHFGDWLNAHAAQYNGYNILFGLFSRSDAQSAVQCHLWYQSNVGIPARPLDAGVYGLSNAFLDTPWHKVEHGKERFRAALMEYDVQSDAQSALQPEQRDEQYRQLTHKLLAVLYDEQQARDEQLPDTGVGVEMERLLSSMFIRSERYGTRNSTVILLDREGIVSFTERIYETPYSQASEQSFTFAISA